jgi:hypothetical protein
MQRFSRVPEGTRSHLVRRLRLVVREGAGNDFCEGCAARRVVTEQLVDVRVGDLDAVVRSASPVGPHVVQQVNWWFDAHGPVHSEPLCQMIPRKEPTAMSRVDAPLNALRHGEGRARAISPTASRKHSTAAVTLRLRRIEHCCECL